jgi:hypothetical protein
MISPMLRTAGTINEHLSTGGTDANHDLTGSTIRHHRTIDGLQSERRNAVRVHQQSPLTGHRSGTDEGLGLSADLVPTLAHPQGIGV